MIGTNFSVTDASRLSPSEENKSADDHKDNSDDPGRNTKCCFAGRSDRVGLYHTSEEAKRKCNRDCEEACKKFAERTFKCRCDIVDRTAFDRSVLLYDTSFLRKRCFGINRCHAKERDDPHPENSAGTTGKDRAGSADDISGSDLSCDCGCKSLERTHPGIMLFAVKRQCSEYTGHSLFETAHLDKTGFDRIKEPDCDQHKE